MALQDDGVLYNATSLKTWNGSFWEEMNESQPYYIDFELHTTGGPTYMSNLESRRVVCENPLNPADFFEVTIFCNQDQANGVPGCEVCEENPGLYNSYGNCYPTHQLDWSNVFPQFPTNTWIDDIIYRNILGGQPIIAADTFCRGIMGPDNLDQCDVCDLETMATAQMGGIMTAFDVTPTQLCGGDLSWVLYSSQVDWWGVVQTNCYNSGIDNENPPPYFVPYEAPENQCNLCGDINGDGVLDVLDVVLLVNIIMSVVVEFDENTDCYCAKDLNQDGTTNILDVVMLVNDILDDTDDYTCGEPGATCDGYVGGPPDVYGCTDSAADNYNWEAEFDDGSCEYEPFIGTLSVIHNGGTSYSIEYTSYDTIGGFEFVLIGVSGLWSISNIPGFMITNTQVDGTIVIGGEQYLGWQFLAITFTGATIPWTTSETTLLTFETSQTPLCLYDVTFADPLGNEIDMSANEMSCDYVLNTPPSAIIIPIPQ